jgi:HTH-type transcriptional regulator / antitoxin HipB
MANKKDTTTSQEHFTERYGEPGTASRIEFEIKAKAFMIREIIDHFLSTLKA